MKVVTASTTTHERRVSAASAGCICFARASALLLLGLAVLLLLCWPAVLLCCMLTERSKVPRVEASRMERCPLKLSDPHSRCGAFRSVDTPKMSEPTPGWRAVVEG